MSSLGVSDIRSVTARAAMRLSCAAAVLLVPELSSDPGVRAVAPWFVVLFLLQLAPWMWERRPDLCSPPVLTGIISAIATAATIANLLVGDEVRLPLVTGTRSDEAVGYAEKALFALILGHACYYLGYYTRLGVGLRSIFPKVRGLVWVHRRYVLVCAGVGAIFLLAYGVFQSRVGVSIFELTQLGAGKRVWRGDTTTSWMIRGMELGFLPALL